MELLKEAETLRRVPLFAKLEPAKLKLLAFTSQSVTFEDGEVLFREGDPADAAYVVLSGEVEIMVKTDSGEVVYGTLGPNQLIGELAVISKTKRTATLRARGTLQVLRIGDEAFLRLVTENPDVALEVIRQLSDKLIRAHREIEASRSGPRR